ncbi:MAG: hypothetical protein DM484_05555 [Candidatus Methylumidiphilus alinenensis]|uniref:Sulfatase-modifying factor enzyme-like domain-containing protein n=1 Tax=Candidatus Methylumidiphilus alinenensis TaxID=2202197 RepID=A0A2W4TEG7_9GAMM|nr:MAG: hypothetical protein DM484_05555 [Candidatus Methylumidiphilus alinenensis]
MTATLTEIAKEKVARFTRQFGEPHRLLAYYAALPLILTPELLNYLRNHFLRGAEVPWVAEADLLLSELCRPVGYEQFAFATDVRAYLIGEMRQRLGETPMEDVARLLIRYVHQLSRTASPSSRDGLQAEQWSAMVFLKEKREEAVAEIAEAFRDHLLPVAGSDLNWTKAVPQAELARLVRITDELAAQLDEYPDLLNYASNVGWWLTKPDGLAGLAKTARMSGSVVRVAGVELPTVVAEIKKTKPRYVNVTSKHRDHTDLQNVLKHRNRIRTAKYDRSNDLPCASMYYSPQPNAPTPFRDLFSGQKTEGPAMVWLPGGIFMMGSPDGVGNDNEHPQHEVTLDHYAVGQYPVTVGEFSRFVEETGYRTEAEQGDGAFVRNKGSWAQTKDASWRNPYFDQTDQNPVVCISWNDAKAYCDWLVEQTGQAYGLLTEAQWEYACRGGNEGRWCFGDNESDLGDYAWYSKNANNQTHPVGQKKPNAWQLHDLHGNVWEWCEDWYDGEYYRNLGKVTLLPDLPLTSKPQHTASASEQSASGSASEHEQLASENPSGPASGSYRVVRGGSWINVADYCRSAYRSGFDPSYRNDILGFRLSRTGPLHSYPFTLGSTELEKPAVPAFIAGLRDPFTDGSESPAMVWLPGGEFMMGQDDSPYDDEKPAHPVRVDAISIGQYPVTFAEYDRFCSATQRKPPDDRSWGRGERPAINVSWQDAMDYCDWLGQQTGEHYRLATEAEWEYACRSGSTTRYCYGDDESGLGDYAWYSKNANGQTHPVGQKKPNAWQLYDLHGNVWEWCADWYAGDYYAQLAGHSQHTASASEQSASGSASGREQLASENPSGPASGSYRVVRGGSWLSVADYCRSADRGRLDPSYRFNYLGFRLSRTGPWRSHPITLGAADLPGLGAVSNRDKQPQQASSVAVENRSHEAQTKPRYQDYQVFHDSLASDAKGGEAPAMVYLPGGTFLMGDEKGRDNEKPVHAVKLDAFAMGRTPVTWGEYRRFCEATGEHWPEWLEQGSQYHLETGKSDHYRRPGISREGLDLPVVGIAWKDANAYCLWLSGQTGEVYALPTEAQWEYACRAGNPGRWCFGDDEKQLAEYAWYDKNSNNKLHPVMGKAANAFGLYDVHGNVWDWCADWYSNDYYTQLAGHSQHTASTSEQSASGSASEREQLASENPSGPASGSIRVVRGGSWLNVAGDCRSAIRNRFVPSRRYGDLGFRLSRTV